MTARYVKLRMCERMGIDPTRMGEIEPGELTELIAFELLRQDEERRGGEARAG